MFFTNTSKKLISFLCLIYCLSCCKSEKLMDRYDIDMFYNKTSAESGYNKWVYPKYQIPIVVNVSIYLFSFGSIDDTRTEYTIQLLLRFEWTDERLVIPTKANSVVRLEGGQWHVNRIWTPSVHIPNNRQPDILQTGDQNPVLTHIQSDGKVLVSKRILLNGFSLMDFRLYPLDKQLCDIEIESNELSDNYLRLEWTEAQPFDMATDFSWNGFQLINYSLTSVRSMYSHTGTFSKLVSTFTLRREFGHFILDIYIPSILFVISSWTSFWVEIPAAPARVTLGITTMLTLVTSSKSARDKLPRVSYVHALDIWIIMCTFFIFASLVEYATVNFIYHKEKRGKRKRKNNKNAKLNQINGHKGLTPTSSTNSLYSLKSSDSMYSTVKSDLFLSPSSASIIKSSANDSHSSYVRNGSNGGIELVVPNITPDPNSRRESKTNVCFNISKQPQDIANEIDRKCRLIFPISFLVINVIYWTTLAMMSYS